MEAEIKNLKRIANRILEAIKNQEKVILYSDADPDGVCAAIILKESLEQLGLNPAKIYFPDREKEGYGILKSALIELAKYSPAIFVTLDCGIGNAKEVALVNEMGFEVIIIDHHEPLPEFPPASIICDPKQKEDTYPFKELATTSIVYKLSRLLFSSLEREYRPERFLELTALATLADQMPLRGENRKLVKEGILALQFTERVGLQALMKLTNFEDSNQIEARQKIIAPLNASGTEDHSNEAYLLLVEDNFERAKKRAQKLLEKVKLRRTEIRRIYQEVEKRIDPSQSIIFEGDESWPLVFLGAVASRICYKYEKPVFLFKKNSKESPGAVRMPEGLNGVKAMIECRKVLKTYGGHPPAAGFRLKNENLEKFKECLIEYFKNLKS